MKKSGAGMSFAIIALIALPQFAAGKPAKPKIDQAAVELVSFLGTPAAALEAKGWGLVGKDEGGFELWARMYDGKAINSAIARIANRRVVELSIITWDRPRSALPLWRSLGFETFPGFTHKFERIEGRDTLIGTIRTPAGCHELCTDHCRRKGETCERAGVDSAQKCAMTCAPISSSGYPAECGGCVVADAPRMSKCEDENVRCHRGPKTEICQAENLRCTYDAFVALLRCFETQPTCDRQRRRTGCMADCIHGLLTCHELLQAEMRSTNALAQSEVLARTVQCNDVLAGCADRCRATHK